MAKQSIGLGTVANDGTGDNLRAGGDKINDNFDEIYTALGDGSALAAGLTAFTGAASDVTSGTFANVRISQASVTQHQAALSLTESQISDLGTYLTTVALNDVSDVTLTTAAQGDILYRNASGWVNLGPGTSGQFLQTQGAAANPQWATPSGSGNVSDGDKGDITVSDSGATWTIDSGVVVGSAMERVAGSTYSTVQHMQDLFHSAGVTTGGGITDDADGTITVAAGTGLIRATNDTTAVLLWTDWAAESGVNVALTDNNMNYVYVEYNAGTPRVVASISAPTELQTNVLLGTVYRSGTNLYITEATRALVGDHALQMIERMKATMPFQRETGAIIGETGTLNITLTAGTFWEGLTQFTTAAFDSSGADTFTYYYRDGASGFTAVTAQSAIDPANYDGGTGTLAATSINDFTAHWVYLAQTGDVYVLYGRGQYNTLAEAQAEGAPSTAPPFFSENHVRLVGRLISQEGETVLSEVASSFDNDLSTATASDHGGLTGLGDDDHTQYLLVAGTRAMSGNLDLGGNGITVTAGTLTDTELGQLATIGASTISAAQWGYLGAMGAQPVESDVTGITGADQITNMVSLTQAEYDALTPNASTFYVIVA